MIDWEDFTQTHFVVFVADNISAVGLARGFVYVYGREA